MVLSTDWQNAAFAPFRAALTIDELQVDVLYSRDKHRMGYIVYMK